jgi:hypothetical protein
MDVNTIDQPESAMSESCQHLQFSIRSRQYRRKPRVTPNRSATSVSFSSCAAIPIAHRNSVYRFFGTMDASFTQTGTINSRQH